MPCRGYNCLGGGEGCHATVLTVDEDSADIAETPSMSAQRRHIRLDFTDFYPGYPKTNNFFYHLLSERFQVDICDNPDFLIYSHEGDHHKLYRCPKIYFTVESFRPDFRECDYAFTCFNLDNPRHLRLPLYVLYGTAESLRKDHLDWEKVMASKTRFCSFVVSNPNLKKTRHRIDFFNRLSKYQPVDSGGKVLNNLGYTIPGYSAGKLEFLKPYKFNISFENRSLPGYTTEKIFEAMQANCLPIYWGNPEIGREFNPKSFLNYFDFPNEDALIEKIIELDQDDTKYLEYLRQPYFPNNTPNEFFSHDRLLDQFEKIFSTAIQPVGERRRFFQLGRWTLARRNKVSRA